MSLSSTAQECFPDTSANSPALLDEFLHGLENISNLPVERQLAEMRQFSAQFYTRPGKISGRDLQEACQALLSWHIEKLDNTSFSNSSHILVSLNRAMANIGCHPVRDEQEGPHSADKTRLCEILVERTVKEIKSAESGCLADMAVKSLVRSMDQIGLRTGAEASHLIRDAMKYRTASAVDQLENPVFIDMWKGWETSIDSFMKRYVPAEPRPALIPA